MPIESKLIGR